MSELTAKQVEWLRSGDRGTSSEALFERLTGHVLCEGMYRTSHPSDPGDLVRCVRMLEQCGLHDRLAEAADLSPTWARLIEAWPKLLASLDYELPAWRKGRWPVGTERTYAAMKGLM